MTFCRFNFSPVIYIGGLAEIGNDIVATAGTAQRIGIASGHHPVAYLAHTVIFALLVDIPGGRFPESDFIRRLKCQHLSEFGTKSNKPSASIADNVLKKDRILRGAITVKQLHMQSSVLPDAVGLFNGPARPPVHPCALA